MQEHLPVCAPRAHLVPSRGASPGPLLCMLFNLMLLLGNVSVLMTFVLSPRTIVSFHLDSWYRCTLTVCSGSGLPLWISLPFPLLSLFVVVVWHSVWLWSPGRPRTHGDPPALSFLLEPCVQCLTHSSQSEDFSWLKRPHRLCSFLMFLHGFRRYVGLEPFCLQTVE